MTSFVKTFQWSVQSFCQFRTIFWVLQDFNSVERRVQNWLINYRPISLLLSTSEIIVKVAHDQASSFSTNNKILYNYQSRFRNHSTGSWLIFRMALFITIYFFKNLVPLFFQKLLLIGSICTFKVIIEVHLVNYYSDPSNITWGVPQWLIKRLLLFLHS